MRLFKVTCTITNVPSVKGFMRIQTNTSSTVLNVSNSTVNHVLDLLRLGYPTGSTNREFGVPLFNYCGLVDSTSLFSQNI